MSIANTADAASQIASPSRSAGGANEGGQRTPAVVLLYVKTTSVFQSIAARSGSNS